MKKILSLILTFVICLSSYSAVIAAESAADFTKEQSLLAQLDVNSGILKSNDEFISREEFVAMAVRIMNVPLYGTDGISFTDCSESKFLAEIATAKKYGITNGTSLTTFSPDENVTPDVAARILVAVLGYTDLAEAKGGYPYGYLTQANALDIFSGVGSGSEYITVGDSFRLIYNTLLADVNIIYGIDGGQILSGGVEGKNLLTENFGYEHVSGVVTTAGGYSDVISYDYDASLVIDGVTLKNGDEYAEFFAMSVDAWYNPDTKTVCALIPDDLNSVVTIDPSQTIYKNHKLTSFDENGREKSYTLESDFTFMLNGRPSVHDENSFTFPHGSLQLTDNDGNGRYDFVIARKTEYFVVRSINTADAIAYDKYSALQEVSLESKDGNYVCLEKNGKSFSPYDLKAENVIEVYRSANSDVCYAYVSTLSVSGKLTEIGDGVIGIDGKFYDVNSYFTSRNSKLVLGTVYTFLLAPDGTVTDISYPADSSMQYAYLLGFGKDASVFAKPRIKLLDSNNNIVVYELADKVKFDGVSVSSDDSGIFNALSTHQLLRFKLTSGKVSAIDTSSAAGSWNVEERKDDANCLTKYHEKLKVYYRSNVNYGIPGVSFDKAVTFTVPLELKDNPDARYDDELFYINPQATLINDTDRIVDVYDYDENFYPGAVVVYFSTKGSLSVPSDEIASGIVRELTDSADSEGNPVKLLKMYVEGLYKQYYIDETIYEILKANGKIPTSGDIVRVTADIKDRVTALAIDVDYSRENGTFTVNYGVDNVGAYPYSYNTYFAGRVISKSGGLMTIAAEQMPQSSAITDSIVSLCVGSSRYVLYSRKSGEAKACDESYIVSGGISTPENGTYVLCKSRYYGVNTVFIYTE